MPPRHHPDEVHRGRASSSATLGRPWTLGRSSALIIAASRGRRRASGNVGIVIVSHSADVARGT
jgi:hypothetical protein